VVGGLDDIGRDELDVFRCELEQELGELLADKAWVVSSTLASPGVKRYAVSIWGER
jgi:hypothetical protein